MPRASNQGRSAAPVVHATDPLAACGQRDVARASLVLVVGADSAALALLLDAARRRFADGLAISFPVLATTHRGLYGGSEIVLSRRAFAAVTAEGGFLATWRIAGGMAGLPVAARDLLEAGTSVVIGVPHDSVLDAEGRERAPWPRTRLVRVTAHTELTRQPLSPRACLSRMMGPRSPQFARAHRAPERFDARVHLGDTIAAAVSRISDAIAGVVAPAEPRPGTAARRIA